MSGQHVRFNPLLCLPYFAALGCEVFQSSRADGAANCSSYLLIFVVKYELQKHSPS